MYAAKESTTALTKASLASARLDETERSTAGGSQGGKKLLEMASLIPLESQNFSCASGLCFKIKKAPQTTSVVLIFLGVNQMTVHTETHFHNA